MSAAERNARRAGACLLVLLISFVPAGRAFAQVSVAAECQADRVMTMNVASLEPHWQVAHPATLHAGLVSTLEAGNWVDAADVIIANWQSLADAAPAAASGLMQSQLEAMRAELAAVQSNPDFEMLRGTATGVRQTRFQPVVDAGRAEFFLESGTGLTVEPGMSLEAVRALCWTAIAADHLLVLYGGDGRARTASALRAAVRAWDNFNGKGYSQFPWELAINGRRAKGDDWLLPPSRQLILLHPSVGIEVGGHDIHHLRRRDVAIIEALGYLWYQGDRSLYYGVSALVSLPTSASIGGGALLHAGPIKVGWVFRSSEAGGSGALISLDVKQIFAGAPPELQAARDRVAVMLQSLVGGQR
jgi:hypothetical protein